MWGSPQGPLHKPRRMITKRQLADQIILLLGKSSPEFRIDIREVLLAVGQVRDELLVQEYYVLMQGEQREIPTDWLTPFTAKVEYDTVRQREYVQLPFEPLHLPGDKGLFSLVPAADEFNTFIPTRPGELGLLRHHPAFLLGGAVGYWREMGAEGQPGKAWFQRRIQAVTPDVLGKAVCPSAAVKDRDPFPISSHLQSKIIDLVRQRYATKPAPDTTADDRDQK
jgi:hypothetical protein